jgi:hypothetical protein
MELHDRLMVGIRTERLELDEAWSFGAGVLACFDPWGLS